MTDNGLGFVKGVFKRERFHPEGEGHKLKEHMCSDSTESIPNLVINQRELGFIAHFYQVRYNFFVLILQGHSAGVFS